MRVKCISKGVHEELNVGEVYQCISISVNDIAVELSDGVRMLYSIGLFKLMSDTAPQFEFNPIDKRAYPKTRYTSAIGEVFNQVVSLCESKPSTGKTMRVTCVNDKGTDGLTYDKEYDVEEYGSYSGFYKLIGDHGVEFLQRKSRFTDPYSEVYYTPTHPKTHNTIRSN